MGYDSLARGALRARLLGDVASGRGLVRRETVVSAEALEEHVAPVARRVEEQVAPVVRHVEEQLAPVARHGEDHIVPFKASRGVFRAAAERLEYVEPVVRRVGST